MDRVGQGLLARDVLAGGQRGQHVVVVKVGRGEDLDGVDVGVAQKVVELGIGPGDTPLGRHFGGPTLAGVAHRDDRSAVHRYPATFIDAMLPAPTMPIRTMSDSTGIGCEATSGPGVGDGHQASAIAGAPSPGAGGAVGRRSRSWSLTTLPVALRGRSSTKYHWRGTLYRARRPRV